MGLTGLAFVFLVVLIGAANLWPFGSTTPKAREETLATLGVTPGAEDTPPPAEPPAVLDTPPLDSSSSDDEMLTIDDSDDLTEI
jgi:hypothetical protein